MTERPGVPNDPTGGATGSVPDRMVRLEIDGAELTAPEGSTILDVCRSAGIDVPTRQGTHWPHDSSRKNAAIRRSWSTMSTERSSTSTTPEPSVALAARVASMVSGRSRSSGPTKPPAAPPSSTAPSSLPSRMPPARSIRSRSVGPNSTSYTPGSRTAPDTQKSLRPFDPSLPCAAHAAPPRSRMCGTFTSVSTLLITVGLPNSPDSTGKGGLLRGSPRYPSIELKIAVSSPQM